MQSLKDLCKTHNLFTFDEIPEKYRAHINNKTWNEFSPPAELLAMPNVETGIFYQCRTQDEGTPREYSHAEREGLFVMRDGIVMQLTGNGYNSKGKYSFFVPYFLQKEWRKLHHTKMDLVKKSLTEPNWIGVWTAKKVNDWFLHIKSYCDGMALALAENSSKNAEIEAEIAAFAATVPTAKVQKWGGDSPANTSFYCKFFDVTFEHYTQSGYVSKKITFKGKIEDVSKFENL